MNRSSQALLRAGSVPDKSDPGDLRWRRRRDGGVGLLELLITVAILSIVMIGITDLMFRYERSYTGAAQLADLNGGIQGAMVLLAQEIAQAGALPSQDPTLATPTLAQAVAAGTETVTLSSVAGLYNGERIEVDPGGSPEAVTIIGDPNTSTNQITATFANSHSAGVPVMANGVIAGGVLPTSTATTLYLIGDLDGNGALDYVRYTCDTQTGQFLRSEIENPTSASVFPADDVIVSGLEANANGAPCFQYTTQALGGTNYIIDVAITLTAQSLTANPVTGQATQVQNRFLNVAPRNMLTAAALAQSDPGKDLQATPPNLPE